MNLTAKYLIRRPKELIIKSIETSYDPIRNSTIIRFLLEDKLCYSMELNDLHLLNDSIHFNHTVHMLMDRLQSEFYKKTGQRTYIMPDKFYKRMIATIVDNVPQNVLMSRAQEQAAQRVFNDIYNQMDQIIFNAANQQVQQYTQADPFRRRRL